MILEAVIHQSHRLCGSATPVGIITILSKKGEDENNEFMGLTNRIRSTIKSEVSRIDAKVSDINAKIESVKSEINANKTDLESKMDRLLALMEAKK